METVIMSNGEMCSLRFVNALALRRYFYIAACLMIANGDQGKEPKHTILLLR